MRDNGAMFKTLWARLLLSYFVVIGIFALIIVVGLWAAATSQSLRINTTSEVLRSIAPVLTAEIKRSAQIYGDQPALFIGALNDLSSTSDIRILWVSRVSGTILHDTAEVWTGRIVNERAIPRLGSTNGDVGTYQGDDDRWWIFFTPPTMEFGRISFIVFTKPEPERLQFFNTLFGQPLRLSIIAAGLVAVALAIGISRSVAKPLQRVASAAQLVGQGKYDQRLPLEGTVEIRSVAENFNRMTEQVQRTQQAQRDFVANVSHDLKTPLTIIQGWSQALLDDTIADGEMQHYSAEIIHSESNRMYRMVQQLLELARFESGEYHLKREEINLGELLAAVERNLQPLAHTKGVTLNVKVTPTVPPLAADGDALIQLFTNLIDNAITYTPSGGEVIVSLKRNDTQLVIDVADTGIGIEEEEIGRIFERFYQTDKARLRTPNKQGSGLGLAICYQIVQAHQGRMSVISQPNVGTTFTVIFPITPTLLP